MNESAFLTVDQTAEYLCVPKSQVYALVKTHNFPVKKIGRHFRIHYESLLQWSVNFTGC